jgi:hypothetical protein
MAFKKNGNEKQRPGRHTILNADQHEAIVVEILDRYHKNRPMTVWEICRMIYDRWGIEMIPDTLYHIMERDARVKTCRAQPMEDARLQVTPEDIITYFGSLYSAVSGVPAHFVMNMDEMGHQPFADARDILCFVPTAHQHPTVRYPVSRTGKRVTLLGCIFADGSHLRPALVIPRETFDDDLITGCGYTSEKVEVYNQKKGYVDRDIFEDWIQDLLLPEIQNRRDRYNYQGQAVLILDNCSAHKSLLLERLFEEKKILCLWLPPHSSHLLQMLDLCIFGVTKRVIARLNNRDCRYIQAEHLRKILDSFAQACAPGNVTASFRLGGVSLFLDADRILRCVVTPKTARRVLDIWNDHALAFCQGYAEEDEEEDDEEYVPEFEQPENVRQVVAQLRRMHEPKGYLKAAGLEDEDEDQ